MEIFDVSVPLREGMVTYPGDPHVRIELAAAIAGGDPVNLTRIDFGLHSGTHVDAPVHFIDGAAGVDAIPLEALVGPCEVAEAPDLSRDSVAAAPVAERILFKTPNSQLWASDEFAEDFARLDGEAATLLVERGVRLVGVDYLSVGGMSRRIGLYSRPASCRSRASTCGQSAPAATSSSACRSEWSEPTAPRRARS